MAAEEPPSALALPCSCLPYWYSGEPRMWRVEELSRGKALATFAQKNSSAIFRTSPSLFTGLQYLIMKSSAVEFARDADSSLVGSIFGGNSQTRRTIAGSSLSSGAKLKGLRSAVRRNELGRRQSSPLVTKITTVSGDSDRRLAKTCTEIDFTLSSDIARPRTWLALRKSGQPTQVRVPIRDNATRSMAVCEKGCDSTIEMLFARRAAESGGATGCPLAFCLAITYTGRQRCHSGIRSGHAKARFWLTGLAKEKQGVASDVVGVAPPLSLT
ncbi:hypothetical protein KC323_g155 [Hortaea werneckii]|nr:hypothetical protein KC323_g155 [Hortaea werneckii]